MKAIFSLLAVVALTACSAPLPGGPTSDPSIKRTTPQVFSPLPAADPSLGEVDAFAKAFLDSIQAQSIAEQREFCGFFFRDKAGTLRATPPQRGTFATCSMPAPPPGSGVFASYHTHGAYGERYDNEVPSVTDLQSDFQLGINGYVSTPGGRIWRVNLDSRDAVQVCGLKCVTSDPGFVPRNEEAVRQRYSILQLALRNGV